MEDDTKLDNSNPMVINKELFKETQLMLHNGMADVLGIGTGGEIGADFFNQISQLDTLFKNQRWGLLSNQRQLLSQMYAEHGIVETVIDVPVDDALRGGLDITTKQLSEEQIKELTTTMESEEDLEEYGTGQKWKRLFGGGAVMVITDQDPSTPLSTAELEGSDVEFKAIDMWELNNPLFHQDDRAVQLDSETNPETPEDSVPIERLKLTTRGGCFDYYGEPVHKSRIRIMKGKKAPSFIRPRLRGWGLSELEKLVRSVNQFLKSTDLTFEVLDEFKLDIFKIKNLKDYMLSPKGKQAISDRVAMANQQKNFQNALTMDAEDDYDHKQLSFTGLAEVMTGIRLQVAMDMRMPMTKIFGMSAAGFNSGEDDIENYNSMVESTIRSKSKSDLLWMVKIRCKQLFGVIPSDLAIAFKPLRVLGAVDEETVKDKKHARMLSTQQAGLMSVKEFKDGCNKAELLPIKLDTSVDLLDGTGNEFGDESEFEREDRKEEEGHARAEESAENGHARAEESAAKAAEREKANPQKKMDNAKFKEEDHPRADDGKFGTKGGSSKKSSRMADGKPSKEFNKSPDDLKQYGYKNKSTGLTALSEKMPDGPDTALVDYAENGFKKINQNLRSGVMDSETEYNVADLDEAFNHSILKSPTKLYRGIKASASVQNLKVGDSYADEAYFSTSPHENIAKSFAKDFSNDGVVFEIETQEGQPAVDLTSFKSGVTEGESEILLPRSQQFEVTKITNKDGVKVISLKTSGSEKEAKAEEPSKSNVSSMAQAKLQKKFPYVNIDENNLVDEKEYSRNEAIMLGRELRAKGNYATIWHIDGPKTGPKSKYLIVKEKEVDNAKKNS